jgi:hypothetical protein
VPLHPIWSALDEFLAGELTVDELADRVAALRDLVDVVGAPAARQLRELGNNNVPNASDDALALATRLYQRHRPGQLARDRAARLARGIVEGSINSAAGTRALARLARDGNSWIPDAFRALADALDDVTPGTQRGWEPGALGARLTDEKRRARAMRAPAIVAARRLLELLNEAPDHVS